MRSYSKQQNRGFTLTEIAIVLAIVGVVLSGIWVAAKSVLDANKANQAVQDITTMASNIRSTFAATTQFTSGGNQTSAMITAGIVPNSLVDPAAPTTAKNAWNGQVVIYLNPSGANARQFRISYYGTPYDACIRIASQLANLGTSDAPVNLATKSGASTTAIPNSGGTVGLSTATINTACKLNVGTATDSTEFDYTIH